VTCPPKTDPHVKLDWWIEGRQGDEQEAIYTGADHQEAAGIVSNLLRVGRQNIRTANNYYDQELITERINTAYPEHIDSFLPDGPLPFPPVIWPLSIVGT